MKRRSMAVTDDLGILGRRMFQVNYVPLGDDEHMGRRLRIDVFKGVNLFVFVNFLGRNLAGNDLAKKAIVVHGRILTHIYLQADRASMFVVRLSYHGDKDFDQETGGSSESGPKPSRPSSG